MSTLNTKRTARINVGTDINSFLCTSSARFTRTFLEQADCQGATLPLPCRKRGILAEIYPYSGVVPSPLKNNTNINVVK